MTWTKRYEQFATSCKLRQSSEKLERYFLRRAKKGQVDEIEIDLREFNKEIARDRHRPYDRKTLKEALAQLDEKTQGLILISKSYTWAIHKILVRPLEIVLQKNSQIGDNAPNLLTGNSMFSNDHKKRVSEQQQQDISKIKTLLGNLGLKYTEDAIMRLWRYAFKEVSNVQSAVAHMLDSHERKLEQDGSSEGISRPHGWLHDCLKYGWYLESEYYQDNAVILPSPPSNHGILKFVSDMTRPLVTGLMPSPT